MAGVYANRIIYKNLKISEVTEKNDMRNKVRQVLIERGFPKLAEE